MESNGLGSIRFRPMIAEDIGHVPMNCHGEAGALSERIRELGSAAILAYDGDQHVGQLQFRKYLPDVRSKEGIFSPDWWGDFAGRRQNLPDRTLCIYCYHVGQLTDGKPGTSVTRAAAWALRCSIALSIGRTRTCSTRSLPRRCPRIQRSCGTWAGSRKVFMPQKGSFASTGGSIVRCMTRLSIAAS